jgi:transcriptional regulator CtsR
VANLADLIEEYLRELLEQSMNDTIEIQRGELARVFQCVPSQITYVLEKRFSIDRGYIVQSRRGGGGYIRILKLPSKTDAEMLQEVLQHLEDGISQTRALDLLNRLESEGVLTVREAAMAKSAVLRETIPLQIKTRDLIRSSILRAMLVAVLHYMAEEE